MQLKLLGAILIICSCAGVGLHLAASYLKEEKLLRSLLGILDYMECELQYRLSPLPLLCMQAVQQDTSVLKEIFLSLAQELEDQVAPNAEQCMSVVLTRHNFLPQTTKELLYMLSGSLGRFDLDGQIKGLEGVRQACRTSLSALFENREVRLRSYRTLGFCAGAALAILLL